MGLHGCSKDQVTSLYQLLVLAKPDQGIERQYHEYTETTEFSTKYEHQSEIAFWEQYFLLTKMSH